MLNNMHPLSTVVLAVVVLCFQDFSVGEFTCNRDPSSNRAEVLNAVKQEILLRLGLHEEPENPENLTDILLNDSEFLKEYELVKENQDLTEERVPCANLDFLSKDTLPFTPKGEVEKKRPLANTAPGDDCPSKILLLLLLLLLLLF